MLGICCFVLSKRPKVVPFGRGANAGGSDSQGASGGAILACFTFGQKGIDLRLYDLINDIINDVIFELISDIKNDMINDYIYMI